ncbi:uncharacterized protein [Branchiostoma lanceolatum]|uniref:Hypp9317 protein n=1 Tax=Branchiostoma lanceolatum TaxID=7740 RepID=A0A8S4MLW2_BRALA|nr:Hypp9317 [Branchiostoma lanceolatum]
MPRTRSSGVAPEPIVPPPKRPRKTRADKDATTSSTTTTTTTSTTTSADITSLKEQLGALTSVTQSIQQSLASIMTPPASTQNPPRAPGTTASGLPTLPPTGIDTPTRTPAETIAASILGNTINSDKTTESHASDKTTHSQHSETSPLVPPLSFDPVSHANTGLHVPLDTGISDNIKDKIWRHKFVYFKNLLPAFQSAPQYTVSLSNTLTPTLTLANRSTEQRHPLSLEQWTTAFLIFHYIYIQLHPSHSPQLLAYQHLVRTLADRQADWLRYDELFRQYREKNPTAPWDTPHLQLYVDALYPAPSSTASSARSTPPSSTASSARSAVPSPKTTPNIPAGYCFQYHKPNGQCFQHNCLYKHSCYKCGSGAHKAPLCKDASSANPRKR